MRGQLSDIQMWTIWCGLVTQECGHPTGEVHTYACTHTHSWTNDNHIIHYYIKYLLKVQMAVGVDPALPYNHVDS